jgi:L-fuculose-phosphate aldolase
VAVGENIDMAFNVAEEVEMVARLYYQTLCIGEPRILNHSEMAEVLEKFKDYGKP